jgi:hypothetical protein
MRFVVAKTTLSKVSEKHALDAVERTVTLIISTLLVGLY